MGLENKVVFVTGAGGGIGRTSSVLVAKEGAKLVVTDVQQENLNKTVELVKATGAEVASAICDIGKCADIEAAVALAINTFGRIDVLFNCAGIVGQGCKVLETTDVEFDRIMNVNVKGTFMISVAVGRHMMKQNSGRIINTASISGKQAEYGAAVYCMSKAAISMMNQALAIELGEHGITSVAICPGKIKTPMLDKACLERSLAEGKTKEQWYAEHTKDVPVRRFAEPEEVAELVSFLACDKSSYINGCDIIVCGGEITH